MKKDTITAIVTPIGIGGVGIIKISGPKAFSIGYDIFIPIKSNFNNKKNKTYAKSFESHKLYYGYVYNSTMDIIIDEVLITFMKAPSTYTTEDIVEIQAHSGFISLNKVLSLVINKGARIADPGEFTKRAFLGGRIDLTQVESIMGLINSTTEEMASDAIKGLTGSSKTFLDKIRDNILEIRANYEFLIEFSGNMRSSSLKKYNYELINKKIIPKINLFIKKEREKLIFQKKINIVIVGLPNVGKSSLMNRLIKEDIVIVSDLPGTTRDIIKEHIMVKNLPIILCDTAGIHKTDNYIEREGIKKTLELIHKSNVVLLVVDNYDQIEFFNKEILNKYLEKIIIVFNKIDIKYKDYFFNKKGEKKKHKIIAISAKKNINIDLLKDSIFDKIVLEDQLENFCLDKKLVSERQYILFKTLKKSLNSLSEKIKNRIPIDILSFHINESVKLIDDILGYGREENLYDHIFNNFCIGK